MSLEFLEAENSVYTVSLYCTYTYYLFFNTKSFSLIHILINFFWRLVIRQTAVYTQDTELYPGILAGSSSRK